jgi:ABC-2 type transport system ATP-binding protein
MKELNRQGKTIIMASHILDEVEKVCTHVAIIQKGVLKTIGSVREVLSNSLDTSVEVEIASEDLKSLDSMIKSMKGIRETHIEDGCLKLICDENIQATEINKFCFEKGVILSRLNVKRKSLETTFLELTGKVSER